MNEEDLDGPTKVEVELVPSQELSVIIKETGLEESLAQEFTINFEEHFKMASEWAKKANKIIVTNENQLVEMEQARTARLFLRNKRIEIENFRVQKKEYYLKAGRAIDKVANFLKDTITPTEEHLMRQEKFVELKKKAEDERLLAKARAEEEARLAEEAKRDAEEKERLRQENEKLREATEKQESELEKIKKDQEEAIKKEREKLAEVERELLLIKQTELIAEANKAREEERIAKAGDSEKLIAFKLAVLAIQIPEVKSVENKRILQDAKSYLYLAISKIKMEEEI